MTVAGRPLAAYQVAWLAQVGVSRVVVSCSSGNEELFETMRQLVASRAHADYSVDADVALGTGRNIYAYSTNLLYIYQIFV